MLSVWLVSIAGGLLGLYAVIFLVVLALPPRQHDPQREMAVGYLMLVLFADLLPGSLLTLAA